MSQTDTDKLKSLMIYPHGALTRGKKRPERPTATLPKTKQVEPAREDKEGAFVVVSYGAVSKKPKYVPVDIDDIAANERRKRRANLNDLRGSEGYAPVELLDTVTSYSVTTGLQPPYATLNVSLSLTIDEAHRYLGGTLNRQVKDFGDTNFADFRNLCAGAWIVALPDNANYGLAFFGKVNAVAITQISTNSVPILTVALTCTSFYDPMFSNEIKQTLRRDASVRSVSQSAIFSTANYKSGFLKAIIDDFAIEGSVTPAKLLKKVLNTLATIDLPSSLTYDLNKEQRTWFSLGDIIQVVDGSSFDMALHKMRGAEADVIKGKLNSTYQGTSINNMTHDAVIRQMFLPMPELMEYFAVFVAMSGDELNAYAKGTGTDDTLMRVYSRLGGIPVLVYRYRPVYPYAPPTSEGNSIRRSALVKHKVAAGKKTDAERFFGTMPAVKYPKEYNPLEVDEVLSDSGVELYTSGQLRFIPELLIKSVQYTSDEAARINYVFVEQVFSNGQAQNYNFARNNARPTLNSDDINRHGLRSISSYTPFLSAQGDAAKRKADNLLAPNALAERLYHNVGMGHQYVNGTLVIADLPNEATGQYLPGVWMTTALNGQLFTFYIESVSVQVMGGPVPSASVTIIFTRGHYGLLAPDYDEPVLTVEGNVNAVYQEEINKDRRET